ncbi:MAG: flavodoxin [Synergistaceae bacterium]|nr:flavodoxin [Synergistaceae bacterium]
MSRIGIIYWSGTGNTEKMSELIERGASEAGAQVSRKHVSSASPDEIGEYDVLVLGSPSMGSEVVEESEMEPFVSSVTPKLPGRKVALFGSYGWGDGEWMRNWAERMKQDGANLLDEGLIINEAPDGEKADQCVAYGAKIAAF